MATVPLESRLQPALGTVLPLVFLEPAHKQLLAIGGLLGARAVVLVGAVFHAPAVPFAEGVVGPVPIAFLHDLDDVAKIIAGAGAGRPADGAELADVDVDAVVALVVDGRFESLSKGVLVPVAAVDLAGVRDADRCIVNALVGERMGLVWPVSLKMQRSANGLRE